MKPLSTYIEYLLMTRHYAFVPGLGGFMFQEEPSRLMLGGRLMPPLRLLKFNRFMDHDDGMLANVIMQVEGLSYDEANQSIRLYVNDLLNTVQHEGRGALGRLGFIFFDEECHIAFRANDQVDQDPVYYGMSQMNLRSWQSVENERKGIPATAPKVEPKLKHHDGIVEMPTRWIRRAAIILIVVGFLVANFIPWGNGSEDQHYANLVDTGSLIKHFSNVDPQVENDGSINDSVDNVAKMDTVAASAPAVIQSSSENLHVRLVPDPNTQKGESMQAVSSALADEVKAQTTITGTGKQYLVIVGSCISEKDAQRLIRSLKRKGFDNLEIFERNGRFRVYINKFAQKDEALSYLYNLRETTPFNDAWLLAVRPGESQSLSLIIKNKDNDQLPMELSYLNRSAERDQG